MLLIYYTLLSLTFVLGNSVFSEELGYNNTINLNTSGITEDETATGIFDVLPELGRFIGFVGFGIGLPSDTPAWFQTIFIAWQSILTIFTIGFIIASIWNG